MRRNRDCLSRECTCKEAEGQKQRKRIKKIKDHSSQSQSYWVIYIKTAIEFNHFITYFNDGRS